MKRGEIYYIKKPGINSESSAERNGRPAIIVGDDRYNDVSDVVEIVYLATQTQSNLPTHIDIRSTERTSIALCEHIYSVAVGRIGDYVATCSEYEMTMVDVALAIGLGLDFDKPQKVEKKSVAVNPPGEKKVDHSEEQKRQADELLRLTTERDIYRTMYENLLERLMRGTEGVS